MSTLMTPLNSVLAMAVSSLSIRRFSCARAVTPAERSGLSTGTPEPSRHPLGVIIRFGGPSSTTVSPIATTDPAHASLLAARLWSQRLAGEPAAGALEATRSLLAIQAQDPRAARLSVRARTRRGHASDVDRALSEERSLVITWVNRGTLHLVASEDEPLLHALTTPQLRRASDRRLAQEGVSPTTADRGIAPRRSWTRWARKGR